MSSRCIGTRTNSRPGSDRSTGAQRFDASAKPFSTGRRADDRSPKRHAFTHNRRLRGVRFGSTAPSTSTSGACHACGRGELTVGRSGELPARRCENRPTRYGPESVPDPRCEWNFAVAVVGERNTTPSTTVCALPTDSANWPCRSWSNTLTSASPPSTLRTRVASDAAPSNAPATAELTAFFAAETSAGCCGPGAGKVGPDAGSGYGAIRRDRCRGALRRHNCGRDRFGEGHMTVAVERS